jgi:hypothetical protein
VELLEVLEQMVVPAEAVLLITMGALGTPHLLLHHKVMTVVLVAHHPVHLEVVEAGVHLLLVLLVEPLEMAVQVLRHLLLVLL